MMAPISWLPISAAATQLGLRLEDVQALVAAKVLHAKAIGGDDHWSISKASVDDYQRSLAAEQPAPSYRGGPPPAWIPWSGAEHPDDRAEQADYEPKDAGDDEK